MLDNIVGHPNFTWRRRETYAVLLFSLWCIGSSSRRGPRVLWIRRLNRALQRFQPWQIIASTLTSIYALRHVDKLVGLSAPEHPPAYLYSSEYNRATWIVNALDAGFASAMNIQPKWLRDLCSVVFSIYYLVHGDEADSKIHKFREVCTVDMLRVTWDKTSNPYLRAITYIHRPRLHIHRKIMINRPASSKHTRPITTWLFFAGSDAELAKATDLILDFPGGGFVAMGPSHHEERLRSWAIKSRRPVLSVDYGKAPEFPYPYAIEEGFDVYTVLHQTAGRIIGMSGVSLDVIMSGDSAGGNLAVNVMLKILETRSTLGLRRPTGLALTYPALNFSFSSWAWPTDREAAKECEHEAGITSCPPPLDARIGGMEEQHKHLSVIDDKERRNTMAVIHRYTNGSLFERQQEIENAQAEIMRNNADGISDGDGQAMKKIKVEPRLTMSSKTGYLHDRIITPSMMWAMALLYIGPRWKPGMETDYHVSPILAPSELLAEFPPILLQCGGRDPLVDDTVLFAARVRQAKLSARGKTAHAAMNGGAVHPAQEYEEGDFVKVQIFPGWSHGYLQMSSIMREARVAIDDICNWISSTFDNHVQNTATLA